VAVSEPRTLVLRALGVGDLLAAIPALRALRRAVDGRLMLATHPALAQLVDLIDCDRRPAIDELVPAIGLTGLAESGHRAGLAVNLHGRGPRSHRVLLATRPKRLMAFAHTEVPESAGGPRWDPGENERSRWCRLLSESGIPSDERDYRLRTPRAALPRAWRGATVIHPGAASPARRWPPARWARVALAERARGRRVLVTGSAEEVRIARAVVADAWLPPESCLAGRTTFRELSALIGAAGRVACADTGIAHLATALGTPSVVLFGPTSPQLWGPPDEARHRVLWEGHSGDPHAARPDPGLMRIHPEAVIRELSMLPAG
jgi:ADP-heptose:LPS heptosyltransferase